MSKEPGQRAKSVARLPLGMRATLREQLIIKGHTKGQEIKINSGSEEAAI